jgi:ankyrin repeat protein
MSPQDRLLAAVESENLDRILAAVNAGADVNARCDDGASVLYPACLNGNVHVVWLLLNLGADPNLEAEGVAVTDYAPTPLDLVARAGLLFGPDAYRPVFDLLVRRGARGKNGHHVTRKESAVQLQEAVEWYWMMADALEPKPVVR